MFKKKRLVLMACLLLLGWVAWRVDFLAAAACFAGAVLLLAVIKTVRIVFNHVGMAGLKEYKGYRFSELVEGLPLSNPEEPWNFVVLGDTRNNTKTASALYRKTRELDPVMAFHTGDIVRGGMASELMRNHVRLLEACMNPVPMFCVPGNHERGPLRDFAAFRALYGDDKFAFSHGGCRFAGFNNCAGKGVSREDLEFLETALAGDHAHKFVFTHIPPAYFEATFVGDARRRGFRKNAEGFHELMGRMGVEEVFFAHIHGYATAKIDGVRYTLTAGGGAPLSGRIVAENRCYHLIRMNMRPGGVERTLFLFDGNTWTSRPVED